MRRKILTGLLSFLIALGLWLYVVTVVSPNSEKTYYNVPVGLQGENWLQEEMGLMVTSKLPTVNLRLGGNRTDLDKLNSSNITVAVDVSKIYEAGEHKLPYTISYPGDVPNNAISTQKRTPDTVTVVVEELAEKIIPVEVLYTGTPGDGFGVDKENIQLDNEDFKIVGPKRILEQIAAAQITVDLSKRKESIANLQLPYVLVTKEDKPVDDTFVADRLENSGMITVEKLRIVRVKQITLVADVIYGGGANRENTKIEISPKTISVSGSETLLKALGDELKIGPIKLEEWTEDGKKTFPIELQDGIICESGETEVEVSVEFVSLRTKTLTVTNIKAVNVPEGMQAKILTRTLSIQFRGPKAQIDALTAKDVTVSVDFQGAQAGTESWKVTVTLAGKFANVGAVNPPSVTATVQQKK